MALLNWKRRDKPDVQVLHLDRATPARTVVAAAMPLSGPAVTAVNRGRRRDTCEEWQRSAWYFYDVIGELRSPVTWIANMVSRATIRAVEVDPSTGLPTGPTENAAAQRAALSVLGGPARSAQLQKVMAVGWQVPGEAWIIVRGRDNLPDEWLVISGRQLRAKGEAWEYTDPFTGASVQLDATRDHLFRVWDPHPDDQSKADSAVRPALPILREIEKSSQNIAARLDSRIASNGILFIPQEMDFPLGESDSKAEAFGMYLLEAMSAGISNPGDASAQVPVIAEMPSEYLGMMRDAWIDLSTAMDSAVTDLRDNSLRRLAATLDMPKEVAEGTQGETNHWSAWLISEDTFKVYVEPLLDRIGSALTEHWYHPALRAMGFTDPERYQLGWDTSTIVARPDETEDVNWLYEHRLISADHRRSISGVPDEAIPSDEETQLRRLEDIVVGAPTLAADPKIAQELFGFKIDPAAAGVPPAEIEGAAPAPEQAPAPARALPATRDTVPDGLTAAAELLVKDALSRAGGRLLTREYRGQFASTPKAELYMAIPHTPADAVRLLEGSFEFTDDVAGLFGLEADRLRSVLKSYTRACLDLSQPHDRATLVGHMKRYL